MKIVVKVGYSKTSYTLNEAEGYVEVCVNAISPGTAAEFLQQWNMLTVS